MYDGHVFVPETASTRHFRIDTKKSPTLHYEASGLTAFIAKFSGYAGIVAAPAAMQHLRIINAFPAGVNALTTSGLLPQMRHFTSRPFAAARAVTFVFDVSFLAIVQKTPLVAILFPLIGAGIL